MFYCSFLCVHHRSEVIAMLSCLPARGSEFPSAEAKPPFLRGVNVPNCTAEDVSTHNTSGNDPFAMATTNKEKFY